MLRRLRVTHVLGLGLLLGCDPAGAPDAGPGGDAMVMLDAGADAASDAAASDAGSDAGSGMCTPEACAAVLGIPPVPEHPCGHCWASCADERTCGMFCFEAQTCIFTAGCGPMCEPLCDTTEDCLLDDVCVDGICVPPEGADETS